MQEPPEAEQDDNGGKIFLAWLWRFVLASAFLILDPFGASQAADRASERVVLAITAPWLSKPPPLSETLAAQTAAAARSGDTAVKPARGEDRHGQRHVTVILIDDAFMKRYNLERGKRATWPISRTDQYDLIFEPILDKAPSALFVDYVFHADSVEPEATPAATPAASVGGKIDWDARCRNKEQPPKTDLDHMVCTLQRRLEIDSSRHNTRVMLAERPALAASDQRQGCSYRITSPEMLGWNRQASPRLYDLVEDPSGQVELVATRFWGPADRYPLAPLALDPVGRLPEDCGAFKPGQTLIASPALALYLHWCRSKEGEAGRQEEGGICSGFLPQAIREDGGEVKVGGFRLYRQDKTAEPLTASVPLWLWYPSNIMRDLLLMPAATKSTERPPCTAVDQTAPGWWRDSAFAVQLGGFWQAIRLRGPGRNDEEVGYNRCIAIDTVSALALGRLDGGLSDAALSALLTDRLVLVGVDLDTVPDMVSNPVNGAVPGVLLHAAVLENLISDGKQRTRESGAALLGVPTGTVLALLLTAIAAFPVSRLALHRGWTGCGAVAGLTAISLFLPLVLAITVFVKTSLAPANWVSALTAKLTMFGDFGQLLGRTRMRGVFDWLKACVDKLANRIAALPTRALLILPPVAFVAVLATIAAILA